MNEWQDGGNQVLALYLSLFPPSSHSFSVLVSSLNVCCRESSAGCLLPPYAYCLLIIISSLTSLMVLCHSDGYILV